MNQMSFSLLGRVLVAMALLAIMGIPLAHAEPGQPGDTLVAVEVKGDVVARQAEGVVIRLQKLQVIPIGAEIRLDVSATLIVLGGSNTTAQFIGPKTLRYEALRAALTNGSPIPKPIGEVFKKIYQQILLLLSPEGTDIVDTVTPAAIRGTRGLAPDLFPISPRNGCIFGDTVRFEWCAPSDAGSLKLYVLDDYSNLQIERSVTGTSYTEPLSTLGLRPGMTYVWAVGTSGFPRETVSFQVASKQRASEIDKAIDGVTATSMLDEAGSHMLKAVAYEQYQCFDGAYREYMKAMRADTSRGLRQMAELLMIERLGLSRDELDAVLPPVPTTDMESPQSPKPH
jgi:hypothetical protein